MSADAAQEQRRFGRVDESVVLRREAGGEDHIKNILRDAPQRGYKNPMCVHRRLERCAQLFELAESDFYLLDSSFHSGELIRGIREKGAYFRDF
jgi:hypothetical protein